MAEDLMRYDILTQDALRGVVRKVLSEVSKTGLPGDHHFFISFATRAPGVRLSQRLLEEYEDEMTIVLQNQYWDLKVSESGFEVGLSFDGQPEMLAIPFSAVKGFFDPSVQFGLQFEVRDLAGRPETVTDIPSTGNDDTGDVAPLPLDEAGEGDDETAEGDKVVSLDSFRKKP